MGRGTGQTDRPALGLAAEAFFAERRGRGDRDTAIRFFKRAVGEPPRPEDGLPE
jgi:hypothetical protein